jgi:hypothetical protein
MVVIVSLLALIVIILLFVASVVRGWIKGIGLWLLGSLALAPLFILANNLFGDDGIFYLLGLVIVILLGLHFWSQSHDPAEVAHKDRVERAKAQRDQRKQEVKNW